MGCWCSDCIFMINLHNFRIGSHLQAKQPRDSWIHEYQWIRESLWEVGRIIYAEVSIDDMAFSVSAKQFFSVLLQREASWSSRISAVQNTLCYYQWHKHSSGKAGFLKLLTKVKKCELWGVIFFYS